MDIREINACRSCGYTQLIPILSLGDLYVTNFVSSQNDQGPKIPLELVLCKPESGGCGLLQLKHTTPPQLLWGEQYWYKSGINSMIREDLKDVVENAKKIRPIKERDVVVDIGCNDGTMLNYYNVPGLILVGFDPSKNVAKEAQSKGICVINEFFNAESYKKELGEKKAKVITAISMFYDLDDPNKFVQDISKCLDPSGLFIIQQNYLATMLSNNAVDNICHEHLEYYSLSSLKHLLNRHGFEIFDVELNEINGGSIRTYIKFKGSEIVQSEEARRKLEEVVNLEAKSKLNEVKTYQDFAKRLISIKQKLREFLLLERNKGKTICGCGASTRGNTLLQYFELTSDIIQCIADKNPDKWGKKTVGTLIPIVSPEEVIKIKPDYQLVLIWHIFKGIGEDEKKFLNDGGKFILPLPEIKVIT